VSKNESEILSIGFSKYSTERALSYWAEISVHQSQDFIEFQCLPSFQNGSRTLKPEDTR
jgi:hypothetical protein